MRPRCGDRGAARAELVIVGTVLALMALLVVPLVRRTHQMSLTLRCRQQLAALFAAVQSYALNYGGYPPMQSTGTASGADWARQVERFVDSESAAGATGEGGLWRCPAGGRYVGNGRIFGLHGPARQLGSFHLKLDIGALADGECSDSQVTGCGSSRLIDWGRHRGGANVVFLDGHVEWVREDERRRIARHWDNPQ